MTNPWLLAWLALALAHQLGIYLGFSRPDLLPKWLAIGFGLLPLAHGPLAFAYVCALVPGSIWARYSWAHLLPYLLIWVGLALVVATGFGGYQVFTDYGLTVVRAFDGGPAAPLGLIFAISGGLYPVLGLWLVRHSRAARLQSSSDPQQIDYHWLQIWMGLHLASFIAIALQQVFMSLEDAMVMASLTMAVEVLFVGYFGLRQILRPAVAAAQETRPSKADEQDARRLDAYVRTQQPYLQPQLALDQLAELSGLAPYTVTAAIRQLGYVHFFDFVNRKRCAHFCERMKADPKAGILETALESGFNSKSAFNRVFAQIYGQTPTVWRQGLATGSHFPEKH